MRNLDPVFQSALDRLEPMLGEYGLVVAAECHHPEAFGSGSVEYKRRGLRLRLVWDGKDRWLWAQYARVDGNAHAPPSEYRDVEEALATAGPALFLRGDVAEARIGALASHLATFLDREAAA